MENSSRTKSQEGFTVAAYYSFIPFDRKSNPLWLIPPLGLILLPTILVFSQPDLGTSLLIFISGLAVMFLAGVNIWYFIVGAFVGCALIFAVFFSRGTSWQFLTDYQMNVVDKLNNQSEQNISILDKLNEMIDGDSPDTKSMKNQ